MGRFGKIVYTGSICYIILCCTLAILMNIFPLEFQNSLLKEKAAGFFFVGIPLAIILTLSSLTYKNIDKAKVKGVVIRTVLFSFGIFMIFFAYALLSFGSALCSTSTGETLFVNRKHSSTKIVKRYFGCGAPDSSPPIISIARQTNVFWLLWYYSSVDTTSLDQDEWTRAAN